MGPRVPWAVIHPRSHVHAPHRSRWSHFSEYLWKLEQPAHAIANGYFVGAINRVGVEAPWKIGEFYGQSYFCSPRGQILAEAAATRTSSSWPTWISA
jgi:predicted amidohydrolase